MNPTTMLQATDKAKDEVANRTHRLGIRLRSVLLLLSKPQAVGFVLQKSPFPPNEVMVAIDTLAQQGFIASSEIPVPEPFKPEEISTRHFIGGRPFSAPTTQAVPQHSATSPAELQSPTAWLLDPAAVLSETKFLLVDFCVDCFNMQSEILTEEIRACQSFGELDYMLHGLVATTKRQAPDHLATLLEVIHKANETARLAARTATRSSTPS